jgi:hypothetical protein
MERLRPALQEGRSTRIDMHFRSGPPLTLLDGSSSWLISQQCLFLGGRVNHFLTIRHNPSPSLRAESTQFTCYSVRSAAE